MTPNVENMLRWSVEEGDVFKTGFSPTAVVSLTAPKQVCWKYVVPCKATVTYLVIL